MAEVSRTKRLVAEFAVIVVGVLVALWIDAGWAWIQDRQEEDLLIGDLRADFEANLTRLDSIVASRNAMIERTMWLLENDVALLPDDSLVSYIFSSTGVETFNPRAGALEAALSSGHITLLRDHELRSALAAWGGLVADENEEVVIMSRGTLDLLEGRADELRRVFLSGRDFTPENLDLVREVLRELYADEAARDYLSLRLLVLTQMVPEIDALYQGTRRIVDLLE